MSRKKDDDEFLAQCKAVMGSSSSDESEDESNDDEDFDFEDDSDYEDDEGPDPLEKEEEEESSGDGFNTKKAWLILVLVIAAIWGIAIIQNPDYFKISDFFKPKSSYSEPKSQPQDDTPAPPQNYWENQPSNDYVEPNNDTQSWWGSQEQTPSNDGSQGNPSASWWETQGA